jgi:hypothetical protein
MQGAVNENSEGGQISTVHQGKAALFLGMKSIAEVQCHIFIVFSILITKNKLFISVPFAYTIFQKQKMWG